jgi:hypothetical protein
VDPEEGDGGGGGDVGARPVATGAGNGATDCEAEDYGGRFHEGTTKLFNEDYGDEDGEAETDQFWVTPDLSVSLGLHGSELLGVFETMGII